MDGACSLPLPTSWLQPTDHQVSVRTSLQLCWLGAATKIWRGRTAANV